MAGPFSFVRVAGALEEDLAFSDGGGPAAANPEVADLPLPTSPLWGNTGTVGVGGRGGPLALAPGSDLFGGGVCALGISGQPVSLDAAPCFGGGAPHAESPRRLFGAMAEITLSHTLLKEELKR